jgi:hypothetical protein
VPWRSQQGGDEKCGLVRSDFTKGCRDLCRGGMVRGARRSLARRARAGQERRAPEDPNGRARFHGGDTKEAHTARWSVMRDGRPLGPVVASTRRPPTQTPVDATCRPSMSWAKLKSPQAEACPEALYVQPIASIATSITAAGPLAVPLHKTRATGPPRPRRAPSTPIRNDWPRAPWALAAPPRRASAGPSLRRAGGAARAAGQIEGGATICRTPHVSGT